MMLSGRRLLEISELYGLKQQINEPTSSLTDLIYTSYKGRVDCSGVSHIVISDHSLVYVYLRDTLPCPTEILKILIVKILEMKSLNKTGLSMNSMIQIWCGLTGKPNFCALLTPQLHFELYVLN